MANPQASIAARQTLTAIVQHSSAFTVELWKNAVFSDIELKSAADQRSAHRQILMSKSRWFQDNCADKAVLQLEDIWYQTANRFNFNLIDENHRDKVLLSMVSFCYFGIVTYGRHHIFHGTSTEGQERDMLLFLYMHLLAKKYGITSAMTYSFEEFKYMASILRGKRSNIFTTTLMAIESWPELEATDELAVFADGELQNITDTAREGAAAKSDWYCKSCRTNFLVEYTLRVGMTAKNFTLEECPNCVDNADYHDGNVEEQDGS